MFLYSLKGTFIFFFFLRAGQLCLIRDVKLVFGSIVIQKTQNTKASLQDMLAFWQNFQLCHRINEYLQGIETYGAFAECMVL